MRTGILSFLAAAALLRADFNPSNFEFRRVVHATRAGMLYAIMLDRTVYDKAREDLADLRLARGAEEVPYVLETLSGTVRRAEVRPTVLDRSVLPGTGLQITLDAGRSSRHNRLRIATGEVNFRVRVRIETSLDGQNWAEAHAAGYVFDFSQDGRKVSELTVDYPLSTRRYVRATFFGWMRTGAVTDAWLTDFEEQPSVWQPIAVAVPARTEERGVSLLVLDLGAPRIPHRRLRIETADTPFHRACEVETSADRKEWKPAGQGVIYRYPEGESLNVTYAERHHRYLRLRIFNGDSRPIAVRQVVFESLERRVKFLPEVAGEYALYYGNPRATQPSYDLGAILAARASRDVILLTPGLQRENPAYRPPAVSKPWSERYPAVLYVTLGLAILIMGLVTARFLAGVKRRK